MSKGGAKAIGIGHHKGVFETGAEGSGPAFQRKAILEVLGRDLGGELARNQLDDAHGLRGHLTGMREDARDENRRSSTDPVKDLLGGISNGGAVLDDLDLGVGDKGGGGGLGEGVKGQVTASNTLGGVQAGEEGGDSLELGGGSGVDDTNVEPQKVAVKANDGVDAQAFLLLRALGDDLNDTGLSSQAGGGVQGRGGTVKGGQELGGSKGTAGGRVLGKRMRAQSPY
jgi:hypothetical protein